MRRPCVGRLSQDRIGGVVHLTSDTHFSHANIIRYCDRPFSDPAVMNERLVDAWNDRVRPDDEIWHLGDVAMGRIEESLLIIRRLHGRKFLVPGNHDRCWPGHKKVGDWPEKYTAAGFTLLPRTTTLTLAGREVLLCHFPYRGDSRDVDRYREERPADEGRWLLHGHVHERWRQRGRQINVGVDVWDYAPVSLETIEDVIRSGKADLDRSGNLAPACGGDIA